MSEPQPRKKKRWVTNLSVGMGILIVVAALCVLFRSFNGPRFSARWAAMSPEVQGREAPSSDGKGDDPGLVSVTQGAYAGPGAAGRVELKLIYDASISVAVDKGLADGFPAKLAEKVQASGGYVSQMDSTREVGEHPGGRITVRIPAAKLKELMDWIGATATVMGCRMAVQDITERYVDLEARLTNLLAGEARLKELLTNATGKLDEVLKVEQEIRRIRQEIEQLQGRKRLWDNQIAFSTLTVEYQFPEVYRARKPAPQTFGERAREALGDSWEAFTDALAAMVILGIYVLPWLPVVVVLVVAGCLLRRWTRRKKNTHP